MKRSILLTLTMTLLATSVAAQAVMRPRPGVGLTAIPKTTAQTRQTILDAGALAARAQPAAPFLALGALRTMRTGAGLDPRITIPDLTSPFQLTPATQSVEGRGSLLIVGQIYLPDPKPAGFEGQAVITRFRYFYGKDGYDAPAKVTVTINAQKNKFYAVDCLAQIDQGIFARNAEYEIQGSNADTFGTIAPKAGHIVFNVRKTDSDGEITILFKPERVEGSATGNSYETTIMDFWGCQISSG